MKQLKLDVSLREETGTNASNRLRKAGKVPAVVYGVSGSRSLTLDEREFRMLMRSTSGSTALVELVDGKGVKTLTVIDKIQRHSYQDSLLHVDFHEVSADKEMHAAIPVHVEGEAYGVKNESGAISILAHDIDVVCLPKDLPEFITVDVTELKVGEAIHLEQLTKIPGVTFKGEAANVIVACTAPTKVEEPADSVEAKSDDAEGAQAPKEAASAEEKK